MCRPVRLRLRRVVVYEVERPVGAKKLLLSSIIRVVVYLGVTEYVPKPLLLNLAKVREMLFILSVSRFLFVKAVFIIASTFI